MFGWKLCGFSLLILVLVAGLLGNARTVFAPSFEYEQLFGGDSDDIASQIIQTSLDNGYLLVGTTTDNATKFLWLVKTDQNGNVQYSKTHNSYGYYNNAFVIQTNNQNYAIAATTKTDENTDYNILFFTTQNSEDQIPDSPESMTFTSGVTLYSPVNITYSSKLLTLNLTAVVGRGIDCTINYNIDNQHTGTVPYTFMFPDELHDLHIQNKVKGTVNLPELTEGTHNLTLQVVCTLNISCTAKAAQPWTAIPSYPNAKTSQTTMPHGPTPYNSQ